MDRTQRNERLRSALRENLKRRKAQAKGLAKEKAKTRADDGSSGPVEDEAADPAAKDRSSQDQDRE
jgi:hypothetical protein